MRDGGRDEFADVQSRFIAQRQQGCIVQPLQVAATGAEQRGQRKPLGMWINMAPKRNGAAWRLAAPRRRRSPLSAALRSADDMAGGRMPPLLQA